MVKEKPPVILTVKRGYKMDYFVNYVDGQLSINTFRKPSAASTNAEDVIFAYHNESEEDLTASIDTEQQIDYLRGIV